MRLIERTHETPVVTTPVARQSARLPVGGKGILARLVLRVLVVLSAAFCTFALPSEAAAQMSPRQRIAACYQSGALNPQLMQMCSGLAVSPVQLDACMRDGPCFGSPPFVAAAPAGTPFCGAAGAPPCPAPRPCGFAGTIACPPPPGFPPPPFPVGFNCGAMGTPFCGAALPCGMMGALPCMAPPPVAMPAGAWTGAFQWNPAQPFQVILPAAPGPSQGFGIQFAAPPIPNVPQLQQCRASAGNEDDFMACMVGRALPPAYRITQACFEDNPDDAAAAFVCSANNDHLSEGYEAYRQVADCVADGDRSAGDVAYCLGEDRLGQNERYYLGCVLKNSAQSGGLNYGAAAACALSKDLNPEQQIAIDCAVRTGGNPKAFAVCTGGRLMARELDKCWNGGVATQGGCFGPNNEFRKFANAMNDQVGRTFGQNSAVAQAYSLWHNNVLAPGPNNAWVGAVNTAIGDIRHGPGPNNEIVKFGNTLSDGVKSVTEVFGF